MSEANEDEYLLSVYPHLFKKRHPESRHDGAFSGPVSAIACRWRKWAERRSSGEGPCVSAWGFDRLPLKHQCFRVPVRGQVLPGWIH